MFRHQRFLTPICFKFLLMVEVTLRNDSILIRLRREEGISKSMLLDKLLLDDPKDLGPNFADSMNPPVPRLIEDLVSRRIHRHILKNQKHRQMERIRKCDFDDSQSNMDSCEYPFFG